MPNNYIETKRWIWKKLMTRQLTTQLFCKTLEANLFRKSAASVNLPSMPASIARIINLTASENVTVEQLAEVVLLDQTLTARVLRLANSVVYSRGYRTGTVSEAILRLGSSQLRNLAASASVIDAVFPKKAFPAFSWKEMWNHSVTCAVASQCIHTCMKGLVRSHDESVFVSGLLHDIGKMVIAYALPIKFTEIIIKCCESDWPMLKSENKMLATNHATVGEQLATDWHLPSKLHAGIAYHHNPYAAGEHTDIAEAVCAGNMLAKRLSRPYIFGQTWDVTLEEIAEVTKLSQPDIQRVIVDTRQGMQRCSEILSWADDLPTAQDRAA